jgi:4-hydroxybenzoate polyprenyltransferase
MTLSRLLKISRPRFWIYLLGPYLIGSILAFEPTQIIYQWQFWLGFVYFTLSANLLLYGVNDIFDYETDKLNPKKQSYEDVLHPKDYPQLILLISALNIPFIYLLSQLTRPYHSIIVLFIGLSLFYSAPPIRAKAKPFLDSFFNILYIFPGLIGYVILSNPLAMDIIWNWNILISAGLWTMAMHSYSAIPDIEADTASNTPTIATILGQKFTLLYCFICYTVSGILIAPISPPLGIGIAIIYGFMIGLSYNQNSARLFKLYTYFPLLNAIMGFVLFWSIVIWYR